MSLPYFTEAPSACIDPLESVESVVTKRHSLSLSDKVIDEHTASEKWSGGEPTSDALEAGAQGPSRTYTAQATHVTRTIVHGFPPHHSFVFGGPDVQGKAIIHTTLPAMVTHSSEPEPELPSSGPDTPAEPSVPADAPAQSPSASGMDPVGEPSSAAVVPPQIPSATGSNSMAEPSSMYVLTTEDSSKGPSTTQAEGEKPGCSTTVTTISTTTLTLSVPASTLPTTGSPSAGTAQSSLSTSQQVVTPSIPNEHGSSSEVHSSHTPGHPHTGPMVSFSVVPTTSVGGQDAWTLTPQGSPMYPNHTATSAMPTFTTVSCVYGPDDLGNAYGGGHVSVPSGCAAVTPRPSNGLPPGYGFSFTLETTVTYPVSKNHSSSPGITFVSPTVTQSGSPIFGNATASLNATGMPIPPVTASPVIVPGVGAQLQTMGGALIMTFLTSLLLM